MVKHLAVREIASSTILGQYLIRQSQHSTNIYGKIYKTGGVDTMKFSNLVNSVNCQLEILAKICSYHMLLI